MEYIVDYITVNKRTTSCHVLGPGKRGVLWVQGCHRACPGCISPETWSVNGGHRVAISLLAEYFLAAPPIEGITFSGGEPMLQAEGLCQMIDLIRAQRDLSMILYTGFTYEQLCVFGTGYQKALLNKLDILIDGPYLEDLHTDQYWRGSSNQRIRFLTERYRDQWEEKVNQRNDSPLEFEIDHRSVHWMGIAPKGFRFQFEQKMLELGLEPELLKELD